MALAVDFWYRRGYIIYSGVHNAAVHQWVCGFDRKEEQNETQTTR